MNKQELIKAINSEIDFIQKNESRPGWTEWAILAGMAGLFWALLRLLQSANYSLNYISYIVLMGLIAWQTLIFFKRAFINDKKIIY